MVWFNDLEKEKKKKSDKNLSVVAPTAPHAARCDAIANQIVEENFWALLLGTDISWSPMETNRIETVSLRHSLFFYVPSLEKRNPVVNVAFEHMSSSWEIKQSIETVSRSAQRRGRSVLVIVQK